MKIFDLVITENDEHLSSTVPSPNALYEDDALTEATLLNLMYYALYSTTALLLDLRTSLSFDKGNTGLIVFRRVNRIVFDDNFYQPLPVPYVWTIGDSRVSQTEQGVEFLLPFMDGKMQVIAQKIEFYVGNVKDIGEIATSLDGGIADYIQSTPNFESDLEIIASSSRI